MSRRRALARGVAAHFQATEEEKFLLQFLRMLQDEQAEGRILAYKLMTNPPGVKDRHYVAVLSENDPDISITHGQIVELGCGGATWREAIESLALGLTRAVLGDYSNAVITRTEPST